MAPLFSICIPTYNRADLLDDCLKRLEPLRALSKDFEIVVSDNGSTDGTPGVLEAHRRRTPYLHAHRLPENRGSDANWMNTFSKAEGEFIVYLADDDSIIPENLMRHIAQMERERDIAAIYTDWIAWDDEAGREMHRYFGIDTVADFAPQNSIGLVNFVLQTMLPPEIGILRRDALLASHSFTGRAIMHHILMYQLSRHGRILFHPLVFYHEHRVLKSRFKRTHWTNMSIQLQIIGDEMRLTLESMLLRALQDSGVQRVPDAQILNAKQMIDRRLNARLGLEVERACARKEWILAVELKRRHVLWNGPGSRDDIQRDVRQLSLPAALQSVRESFRSMSDIAGVSFRGFQTSQVRTLFAAHFPDIPLIEPGAEGTSVLIVHRDERTRAADHTAGHAGNVLVLSNLIDLYRVALEKVDFATL